MTTSARLPRRAAREWVGILHDLAVPFGDTVLVAGHRADAVADAYQAAGAPPVAHASAGLAVLAKQPPEIDFDAAQPPATALDPATVDLVVLRHAWAGPAGLADAIAEAKRVLAPGGTVLLCEPDLARLMRSPYQRYHSQLLYRMHPEVAAQVGAGLVRPGDLAAAAVRAGFASLDAVDLEETVGSFEPPDYIEFLRTRGWRGFELLNDDQVGDVIDAVSSQIPLLAPIGPVVEREPWRVLRGVKPA